MSDAQKDTAESLAEELRAIAVECKTAHATKDYVAIDLLESKEKNARLRYDALHWQRLDEEYRSRLEANASMVRFHDSINQLYRDGFAQIVAAIREAKQ